MRSLWLAVCAVALSTASLLAGKPAPTPPGVAVNLWFDDSAGQAIKSDGRFIAMSTGDPADYIDGLQNVLAGMDSNFRFTTQSDTKKPPQRCATVDFGTQIPDGTLPFGSGASSQCVNILQAMLAFPAGSGATYIQSVPLGGSIQKLVRWEWQDGGYFYRLGYGSDYNKDGVPDSPPVTVTCVAAGATGGCTKWILTPANATQYATESSGGVFDPNAQTGTAAFWRAKILKGGNEGPPELIGYYVMPFTETFTPK